MRKLGHGNLASTLAVDSSANSRSQLQTANVASPRSPLAGGVLLGGYSVPPELQIVVERGQGARISDESGKSYIDHAMGAGALILGHAHPAVAAALVRQIEAGSHYFAFLNKPAIALATEIVRAVPCAERVAFTTTGSEATMYALRISRAATGRQKILKFEGAYHGNHDYALMSMMPPRQSNYPTSIPDSAGIPSNVADSVLIAQYNDIESTTSIVDEHWRELAAIIVTPVQHSIAPQPGFLEGLRRLCDRHGIILVFDEVVTGFRLAYGGGGEYFSVTPDLAALGKILGGGVPLGAVVGRSDLVELSAYASKSTGCYSYMNGTFHGNPLGASAGLAALEELRRPSFYSDLNRRADDFLRAINERFRVHDITAVATGVGSVWDVIFRDRAPVSHADCMSSDFAMARKLDAALIQEGLFLIPGSRRFLSAVHGDDDLEASLAAFDRACRRLR